jgi:methionyl-tRNA formyltransferase
LPEYRGGAHYTWQILNGDRRGACNLQVVLGGEESFHRGPLIKSGVYTHPETARTPADYFATAVAEERAFVGAFLDQVARGEGFVAKPLDEANASYFPFLHTKVHGWIDWSGMPEEVDRFIGAFGDPYPGASTWWRGHRVFLKDSRRVGGNFHPFAKGLVFRNNERGVWIAVAGGALLVERVIGEDGADMTSQIALGSRFVTPVATLDEALSSEIVYGASGPLVERTLP